MPRAVLYCGFGHRINNGQGTAVRLYHPGKEGKNLFRGDILIDGREAEVIEARKVVGTQPEAGAVEAVQSLDPPPQGTALHAEKIVRPDAFPEQCLRPAQNSFPHPFRLLTVAGAQQHGAAVGAVKATAEGAVDDAGYSDEEFERLFKTCQEKEITLLIDEAYHYFYPKTFIKYALKNRRVLVTRTFSKLFSMAGCRLGYVVGNPEDIKYVQKFCTPHNTNAFAMLFAEKIITTPGMVDALIAKFNEGRNYLLSSLDANGYRHKGEAGNFLFIEPKTDAGHIVERMKNEMRILIKEYPNVGEFGNCLRVSIGEKQYMERFMDSLLKVDKV